jgi:hypothetical protein
MKVSPKTCEPLTAKDKKKLEKYKSPKKRGDDDKMQVGDLGQLSEFQDPEMSCVDARSHWKQG